MVYFVGAGCGAPDLITVRGKNLLEKADVIIYAGSLVNPALLRYAKEGCDVFNSAYMTLDEIIEVIKNAERGGRTTVRLHTGDASLYGAVREQMDRLDRLGIEYESCPGVSACFGAAADMDLEFTIPGLSQTLIITRMAGRTEVPDSESIERLASHRASMAVYLSAGMCGELSEKLKAGGYPPETPAAIVYKATWPEEIILRCTVGTLGETAAAGGISRTAVILVGDFLEGSGCQESRLYSPDFETGFRKAGRNSEAALS